MQEKKLKQYVRLLCGADGSYRGLLQVPFHIGVCLNLMRNGYSASFALSSVVFWVIGLPRFFSFATEVLGGVFAHQYGGLGSFILLPIGYALRTVAMIGFLLGCIISSPIYILSVCSVAVLLGEIGRSLNSGAFEDSYKRTAEKICDTSKELVAACDVVGNLNLLLIRAIIAAIGTFCILSSPLFFNQTNFVFASLPFVVGIIIHAASTFISFQWYSWAKRQFKNEYSKTNMGTILGQLQIFFKKRDYLWCLGIGGCINFVLVYSINLAPLTVDTLLTDFSEGKLGVSDIFSATLLSFAVPFANYLGVKWFFQWVHHGKNRQDIFRDLDAGNGIFYTLTWLVFALVIVSQGHWGHFTVVIASSLAFLLAPLTVWMGWMRIPLLEEAERIPEFKKHIGDSHVFYYSLLEGAKETSFAIVTFFYSWSQGIIPLASFGFLLGLSGILCLVIWKRSRQQLLRDSNELLLVQECQYALLNRGDR